MKKIANKQVFHKDFIYSKNHFKNGKDAYFYKNCFLIHCLHNKDNINFWNNNIDLLEQLYKIHMNTDGYKYGLSLCDKFEAPNMSNLLNFKITDKNLDKLKKELTILALTD